MGLVSNERLDFELALAKLAVTVHPTEDARKKYLQEHPGASPRNHVVKKPEPDGADDDDDLDFDIKHLHQRGKTPGEISKLLKQQGVADLSVADVEKRLPKKAPPKAKPAPKPTDDDDEVAEDIRDMVKDRYTPKQIAKVMNISEAEARELVEKHTKAGDRPKPKTEQEKADEVASLMKEKLTPKQIQERLLIDEDEMRSLIKKRFGPKSKTAALMHALFVSAAFEAQLAEKELKALSPGELDLLRFVRRHPKPISLRELTRKPEFHGWDLESLKVLAERLRGRNMVTWDGMAVGPSYVAGG